MTAAAVPGGRPGAGTELLPLFRRIFVFARPYRLQLAAAFSMVALASAATLAAPAMVRFLIDAVLPGGDPSSLPRIAMLLLALFTVSTVLAVVRTYLLDWVGQRIVSDLSIAIHRQLQALSPSFFHQHRTGELLSRLSNDVAAVRSILTTESAAGLSQVLLFFGALALMVATSPWMALFLSTVIPLVGVLTLMVGRHLRRLSVEVQDSMAAATTIAEEGITGFQLVRAFQREDFEVSRYRSQIEKTFRLSMARSRVRSVLSPLIQFLFYSAMVLVLWIAGREVLTGRVSAGELVTFLILALFVAGSAARVFSLWTQVQQTAGATARLLGILDAVPEVVEHPRALTLSRVEGNLALRDVSFAYPDASGRPSARRVLQELSLSVASGERLALVGPSGAGKSTLMNLLLRFYDPVEGAILLDGQDLRTLKLASLRQQMAVVPQEVQLFGGTVRDNLLYGRPDASERELIEAAKAANSHDFIRELADGYDTVVGERGVRLSGGQRQRISIARALLKQPRILLLDEATSSLDSESEGLVQEALARLMAGRTALVIAHRLSTVRGADRVAVLDAGRLVELGRHEELLANNGLYYQLCRLQFRWRDPVELGASPPPLSAGALG